MAVHTAEHTACPDGDNIAGGAGRRRGRTSAAGEKAVVTVSVSDRPGPAGSQCRVHCAVSSAQ